MLARACSGSATGPPRVQYELASAGPPRVQYELASAGPPRVQYELASAGLRGEGARSDGS
jgi:hypothetical protein